LRNLKPSQYQDTQKKGKFDQEIRKKREKTRKENPKIGLVDLAHHPESED